MELSPNTVTYFVQVTNKYIEQFQAKDGYQSIDPLWNNWVNGAFHPQYYIFPALLEKIVRDC